ncbi:hypothetical protein I3842_15G130300 [Carya illinoinensis]|uniref:Uncharacterized protein n=1 Tax=Carya illinoinensis TaxID=32201 RepID=A0A922ABP7_CARIL|nr:hypothetical protein I3842_15G130300 [Carya illinoinensis]
MKVLWFLVRLYCVFLLIFLHASFGTAQKGREHDRPRHVPGSPDPPPGSHP